VIRPMFRTARLTRRAPALIVSGLLLALTAGPASAAGSIGRGSSTTTDPYVLPYVDGVEITSLLTVNDAGSAGNGYEFVGIPDGIGVTWDGDNVALVVNHELRDANGIVRRHGQKGAFASKLKVDLGNLAVLEGEDLVDPGVLFWDYPSEAYVSGAAAPRFADGTAQDLTFGRWCSGTLSDPGLFWSDSKKVGYRGQIYFGNEEDGDIGRTFGVTTSGTAQALPRLGLFSWENTIPAPNKSATTLVMGQEDGPAAASQLWVYVGEKQNTGNAFDRAGLTNGADFVIDAVNQAVTNDDEWRATYPTGVAAPVVLNGVPWDQTGADQNAEGLADGLSLDRIEDGYWDPRNPNDFYFLTTIGGAETTTGRDGGGVWLLRFKNIEKPEKGATLTLVLDGSEALAEGVTRLTNPDNMTIDRHGNLLIQEDPGNNPHLARIVAYRIKDGALGIIAQFDPNLFDPTSSDFWTQDEESSGIIDAERQMGAGAFFLDAQLHTAAGLPDGTGEDTVEEYVENGQLLFLRVSDWAAVYGD
jgi:hypothetical protein